MKTHCKSSAKSNLIVWIVTIKNPAGMAGFLNIRICVNDVTLCFNCVTQSGVS
jgi:hypothetical protein